MRIPDKTVYLVRIWKLEGLSFSHVCWGITKCGGILFPIEENEGNYDIPE